ncbi:MAG TPA: SAM hydroxide adenosyltransferase [Candidatus Thermoplasmatota archaeon]|nr:SAM hydroxide adenosyltransferase [Candidatus Thermoplasmatota archaeon]
MFHARDVFAPVAAHLHEGGALEDVGPEAPTDSLAALALAEARVEGAAVVGRVLAVDAFGNATTSIPEAHARRLRASERVTVEAGGARFVLPFCRTYGEVAAGRPLVLVGSAGFVEIAVNRGSAAERLGLASGQEIRLSP